jgi:hypothetical protein
VGVCDSEGILKRDACIGGHHSSMGKTVKGHLKEVFKMKEAPKKLKPTHISAVGWLEARGVADAHIRLNGKSMRSLVQGGDDTCSFYTNCSNVQDSATHTRRNATDKEATSGAHPVSTAGHVQRHVSLPATWSL